MPTSILESTQSSHEHEDTPAATSRSPPQQAPMASSVPPDHEWLFSSRCESARAVSTLLSCLRNVSAATTTREDKKSTIIQPVTVFCSPASLTFHVYGTARQSQASVDLQATLFSEYRVSKQQQRRSEDATADEDWQAGGEFCVNLTTVLDCLHVLGTQNLDRTKLYLSYNLTDEIFKMELLDEGILSTAAIPGMLPPDNTGNSLALAFRSNPIVARIILKSEYLSEALQELDLVHGATSCTVALGPNGLELAAVGHIGECLISLPADGTSIVHLDCKKVETRTYPLHSLQSGTRGLEIAEETCMSINGAGMIAIQHQVLDTVTQGPPSFVDFIMSCLEEDEEERSSRELASQRDSSYPTPSMTMGWDDDSATRGIVRSIGASRSLTACEENESDDEPLSRPASAVPLFGTVATQNSHKAIRRRRCRSSNNGRSSMEGGVASIPSDDDSDREMDVATLSTPLHRRRQIEEPDDGSSSTEVEYD